MLAPMEKSCPSTRNGGSSGAQDLLGHHLAVAVLVQVRDHHHELVAAVAREGIGLAHAAGDAVRGLAQHGVHPRGGRARR
jgi:hypothetical protein